MGEKPKQYTREFKREAVRLLDESGRSKFHGLSHTLAQLLVLRREYRSSFGFVLACLPTIARLHLCTALGNRFPREVEPRGSVLQAH